MLGGFFTEGGGSVAKETVVKRVQEVIGVVTQGVLDALPGETEISWRSADGRLTVVIRVYAPNGSVVSCVHTVSREHVEKFLYPDAFARGLVQVFVRNLTAALNEPVDSVNEVPR